MPVVLFATLAVLSWAGFLLVLRGTMQVWPTGLAGVYSRIVTIGVMAVIIALTPGGIGQLRLRKTGGWLVLMGLVAVGINILWFAGMKWTDATDAALVLRMDILFVVVLGPLLRIERINAAGLLVSPLMLAGLALIMQVQQMRLQGRVLGDLMMLGAALGLAINAFVIRHILQQLNEQAVAFYNHLCTGLGFAVLALVQGVAVPPNVSARPMLWWWIPALGVTAAISLPLYYAALRRMQVWKLRVVMLATPLLTAAADWLIWRQTLDAGQWVGAAMLLGGVLWLIYSERQAETRLAQA